MYILNIWIISVSFHGTGFIMTVIKGTIVMHISTVIQNFVFIRVFSHSRSAPDTTRPKAGLHNFEIIIRSFNVQSNYDPVVALTIPYINPSHKETFTFNLLSQFILSYCRFKAADIKPFCSFPYMLRQLYMSS